MKTWIKILLILFVLGIAGAFLVYKFYINKPHPDIEKMTPDFTLKAADLFSEYLNNKAEAEKKFNGKIIQIQGNLAKAEVADTVVTAVFVFKQGDFGDEGIRCNMSKKFHDEIQKKDSGVLISIKGRCSGYNETDVIFEQSSIVKE